ncbi:MAG: hypothetical protein AB1505_00695 [Candidatus Latescibacterota bacterium]
MPYEVVCDWEMLPLRGAAAATASHGVDFGPWPGARSAFGRVPYTPLQGSSTMDTREQLALLTALALVAGAWLAGPAGAADGLPDSTEQVSADDSQARVKAKPECPATAGAHEQAKEVLERAMAMCHAGAKGHMGAAHQGKKQVAGAEHAAMPPMSCCAMQRQAAGDEGSGGPTEDPLSPALEAHVRYHL